MKLSALIISLLFTSILAANDKKMSEPVDEMLDRLERKLLEQEASTLRIQAPSFKKSEATKPRQKMNLPSQTIRGKQAESDQFSQVDEQIQNIEAQVEDLSQRVEKLNSDILEKSEKAAYVEIQLQLEEPESTGLRDLAIAIDQHTIYEIGKTLNPWLPSPQIMIYNGPLEPGKHLLHLKAQTLRKYSDKIPLDTNLFHKYNQEIKIDIPSGPYRKGYKIKLAKPEKQNTYAQATLETYEIP